MLGFDHEKSPWNSRVCCYIQEKIKVSPTLAESMVLRWFSRILASNHLKEITIESDSEVTVKCLEGSVCEAQLENKIVRIFFLVCQM